MNNPAYSGTSKISMTPVRQHRARIRSELRRANLSWLGRNSPEARYLPTIIHPSEAIGGVVYGRNGDGAALLAATDRRIIYLNKRPLFLVEDEINYDVVSGVKLSHAGPGTTVTLHTRVKDYSLRTLRLPSAEAFVRYIEDRCLEHSPILGPN